MQNKLSTVKKLKPLQLAAVIFLTVSGGPYGLEPLLVYAKDSALLLLIVSPLLWDLPTIFVVLELNSMMPVTGGYYQWVKRALGLRWAFYEGWWTWLYTFVDLAIYPVLFVEYAVFFFPEIEAYKVPVCLAIVWLSAGLNILGIVPVGRTAVFLGAAVFTPFIILFISILYKYSGHIPAPHIGFDVSGSSNIGLALYTVMWNFIGWDNTTTYAGEVEKPVRSYLISVGTAFASIFVIYFMAVYMAQIVGPNVDQLNEEGFPLLGSIVGGNWLGALLAAGGMASALGLYSAVLLSVSRIPQVMADDKFLPAKLNSKHIKFDTPYVSILSCSVVVSCLVVWTFEDLLIIDVTLYGAALFLEFIALIALRIKAPDEKRPFKIPLNIFGLCLLTLLPLAIYLFALAAAFNDSGGTMMPLLFALATLLSAEVIWQVFRLQKRNGRAGNSL